MFTSYLRIVPEDPIFVPELEAQHEACKALQAIGAGFGQVSCRTADEVGFVDAGGNWEGVRCPCCDAELESWWQVAMDQAYKQRFRDLCVTTPCCGTRSSLNELRYPWRVAFSRFVMQIDEPGITDLDAEGVARVEAILGCKLKLVWGHI